MVFYILIDAIFFLRFFVVLRFFRFVVRRFRSFVVLGKGGLGGIVKRYEIFGVFDFEILKDFLEFREDIIGSEERVSFGVFGE